MYEIAKNQTVAVTLSWKRRKMRARRTVAAIPIEEAIQKVQLAIVRLGRSRTYVVSTSEDGFDTSPYNPDLRHIFVLPRVPPPELAVIFHCGERAGERLQELWADTLRLISEVSTVRKLRERARTTSAVPTDATGNGAIVAEFLVLLARIARFELIYADRSLIRLWFPTQIPRRSLFVVEKLVQFFAPSSADMNLNGSVFDEITVSRQAYIYWE